MRRSAAASPGGQRTRTRPPAVAGRFYEGRADRLAAEVDRYLAHARAARSLPADVARGSRGPRPGPPAPTSPTALVVPHAGHVYSGPVAAFAYAEVDPLAVARVVLLGPAHYVPVPGIGLSSAFAWATPLGDVPLDTELAAQLGARYDDVVPADAAHAPEHSLEVQLPFLQRVLGDRAWTLLPLIVGADLPDEVGDVIATCARLPATLVVVSTDLSHYLDHDTARRRDDRTIAAVLDRRPSGIGPQDACGRHPLRGLLSAAATHDWYVELLDARTSGDTAGSRDRVVGYAAFAVWAPAAAGEDPGQRIAAEHPGVPAPDPSPPRGEHDSTGAASPPGSAPRAALSASAREDLLGLARDTVEEALATGRRPRFDVSGWAPVARHPELAQPGAAFVTLRGPSGQLLGCIGSLSARQPLAADVAEHAYDAAFRDPRFPPLTRERALGMVVDVSVLTPPRPFPVDGYAGLVASVVPGTGLVLTAGRHRATFLPAVWAQLPDPASFLAALWRKAGLTPGEWPPGTRIETYWSEEFAEQPRERSGAPDRPAPA